MGYKGLTSNPDDTFDMAPLIDEQRRVERVEPMGDDLYRVLLKARARRLRGGANRETIEAVLAILFPRGRGYVDETGYLDGTEDAVLLRVAVTDTYYYRIIRDRFFERLVPRPAGVMMEFRRTDREENPLTWDGNPLTWDGNPLTWGN